MQAVQPQLQFELQFICAHHRPPKSTQARDLHLWTQVDVRVACRSPPPSRTMDASASTCVTPPPTGIGQPPCTSADVITLRMNVEPASSGPIPLWLIHGANSARACAL